MMAKDKIRIDLPNLRKPTDSAWLRDADRALSALRKIGSRYVPAETDRFAIRTFSLTREDIVQERLRAAIRRQAREVVGLEADLSYVKLVDKHLGEVIMSNTPMEIATNSRIIREASGNVLIGGLGLGLIVLAMQELDSVTSITVIEKYTDIISLVSSQVAFNDKVQIVNEDIFTWPKPKGQRYETVYFDIWNTICADHYEDMKKLHRRYTSCVNRTNTFFFESWRRAEMKHLALS